MNFPSSDESPSIATLSNKNTLQLDSSEAPKVHVRWYYSGAPVLLSSAPITLGPQPAWQPLTREESDACEEAWRNLSDEDKQAHNKQDIDPEFDEEDMKVGIPVSADKLFEVGVKAMKLYSVYWTMVGVIPVTRGLWMLDETRPVDASLAETLELAYLAVKPWQASYLEELNTALEIGPEAQDKLKYPLQSLPNDSQSTNIKLDNMFVIFEDDVVARVYSGGIPKRFAATILNSFGLGSKSPNVKPTLYGGTVYYRGGDEARERIRAALAKRQQSDSRSRSGSPSSARSAPGPERRGRDNAQLPLPDAKRQRTGSLPPDANSMVVDDSPSTTEKNSTPVSSSVTPAISRPPSQPAPSLSAPLDRPGFNNILSSTTPAMDMGIATAGRPISDPKTTSSDPHEVTDLILMIHGIGQGLTATYEAFDFVYATNMFREVARKQSQSPAISSIMRDKRVQFLPIQWRASLKLDIGEELEKQRDGLDNRFTLADITLKNTIPFVRDLTNNVLLDIPLFMSHHRERMITSVCTLANRTYKLWCARHPGFEKHGRVHIIAHSLGSALVADILSNQPTVQPSLAEMAPGMKSSGDRFVFNTSSLFLIGSPLGVFLHLNQRQIIARKGRERTMGSPVDEALDKTGIFGCMAIDSLYNIFNPSDPVVYILNPCVDAQKARELPATAIPNVTETYLTTFSTKVSKIFEGIQPSNTWFSSSPSNTSASTLMSGKKLKKDGEMEGGIEFELGGETKSLEGSKAERRFAALNPHGTLDFYLPSEGNISEYVDMITAHSSYWSDPSLAAFVLAEIYATRSDIMRTSFGVTETSAAMA